MQNPNSAEALFPGYGVTWGYSSDLGSMWITSNVLDAPQAKWLTEKVATKYPGYQWCVQVRCGLVTVRNFTLAPDFGFHINPKDMDNDGKVFLTMCGELLERYQQNRGRADIDAIVTAKRDIRGAMAGHKGK